MSVEVPIVHDASVSTLPTPGRRGGRPGRRWHASARSVPGLGRRAAPLSVALVLLLLGYLRYAPGTAYSLSGEAYRAYAFPAFRYSDLIWLYLRDGLAARPIPYLDYPLEYPPLTGLLSYGFGFAPDLPTYFAVAYLTLALCALGTVVLLARLPGTNPWYVAAAPALLFYTGHQWDTAAIFATVLALAAFARGRDRWGALGLVAAVWLKFFPLAFLAAILVERFRQRRFRALAEIGAVFLLGTIAVNLPVAAANLDGWSFFFRWNGERPADAGLWVLWRDLPIEHATRLSAAAAVIGGGAIAVAALRARGPVLLPLGATFLLWWLLVNKTFTTHLALWVFLALALLRPPWWIWGAMVVVDAAAFQLGNFLNLPNVAAYDHAPLILEAVYNLYDPLQIVRSVVLLTAVGWGVRAMVRSRSGSVSPSFGVAQRNGGSSARPARLAAAWGRPAWVDASRFLHTGPGIGMPSGFPVDWSRPSATAVVRPIVAAARRSAWPATVVTLYAAATILMTWPYAANLRGSTVVGMDPLLQIWLSRWIQHALITDPLRLYEANIFHPFSTTLAYTDANIPGALLAAPLQLLTGDAILTNGLMVLASFLLAAGGMYALVLRLSRNRAAAFLAGLAFAFLPFRLVHLWHLNWLQNAWLPWIAVVLLALLDRPRRRTAVLLGILIAIQGLTSFYFVVQIAIVVAAVLLVATLAGKTAASRPPIRRLLLAAGVAALFLVPAYLPYLAVRADQGLERDLLEAEYFKARLGSYLAVVPWDRDGPPLGWLTEPAANLARGLDRPSADGHRHREYVREDALFPGGLACIGAGLALLGWRRRPAATAALLLIGGIAFLLSLGPSWTGAAGAPSTDGGGPPLPYRFLFDRVPFFTAMRVPARLGGLVGFAVVALGGLGAARSWEWLTARPAARRGGAARARAVPAALTIGLAALLLAELHPGAIPIEPVDRRPDIAAPYEWLASQPDRGPVMEFPADPLHGTETAAGARRHVGLAMYWSTRHWRPLVNGYSGFVPEAHTELLAAFLGDLPRPDGTVARGVSHVDADNAALLRQLGVRYLIVHRAQYAPADWPAVLAALEGAAWALDPQIEVGEAAIYRVRPTVADPTTASVTLYAPTLATPQGPWAPSLVVRNPDHRPSLLALTRPPTLTATWFDARGRRLRRFSTRLDLPTIVGSGDLLCRPDACAAAPPGPRPDALPPPAADLGWRPREPGHYVVRVELDGDRPIDCTVDLDVVEDVEAVQAISPDNPQRWAECVDGSAYPINEPGSPPFASATPSATLVGDRVALESTLTSRRDEEIRAWFLLAPPDSKAPWREVRYRSPTRQSPVRAGETVAFDWLETLPPEVTPGVYDLSVWYHRRRGNGWEHAFGGAAGLPSVVVDGDGSLRWAGPLHLRLDRPAPPFQAGRAAFPTLTVEGEATGTTCAPSWRLVAADGVTAVASGRGGTCDRPRVGVPVGVPPGRYDLVITAVTDRDGEERISDALTLPITVRDQSVGGPS